MLRSSEEDRVSWAVEKGWWAAVELNGLGGRRQVLCELSISFAHLLSACCRGRLWALWEGSTSSSHRSFRNTTGIWHDGDFPFKCTTIQHALLDLIWDPNYLLTLLSNSLNKPQQGNTSYLLLLTLPLQGSEKITGSKAEHLVTKPWEACKNPTVLISSFSLKSSAVLLSSSWGLSQWIDTAA